MPSGCAPAARHEGPGALQSERRKDRQWHRHRNGVVRDESTLGQEEDGRRSDPDARRHRDCPPCARATSGLHRPQRGRQQDEDCGKNGPAHDRAGQLGAKRHVRIAVARRIAEYRIDRGAQRAARGKPDRRGTERDGTPERSPRSTAARLPLGGRARTSPASTAAATASCNESRSATARQTPTANARCQPTVGAVTRYRAIATGRVATGSVSPPPSASRYSAMNATAASAVSNATSGSTPMRRRDATMKEPLVAVAATRCPSHVPWRHEGQEHLSSRVKEVDPGRLVVPRPHIQHLAAAESLCDGGEDGRVKRRPRQQPRQQQRASHEDEDGDRGASQGDVAIRAPGLRRSRASGMSPTRIDGPDDQVTGRRVSGITPIVAAPPPASLALSGQAVGRYADNLTSRPRQSSSDRQDRAREIAPLVGRRPRRGGAHHPGCLGAIPTGRWRSLLRHGHRPSGQRLRHAPGLELQRRAIRLPPARHLSARTVAGRSGVGAAGAAGRDQRGPDPCNLAARPQPRGADGCGRCSACDRVDPVQLGPPRR